MNDNNNVWGFKSERVDELLDEYVKHQKTANK